MPGSAVAAATGHNLRRGCTNKVLGFRVMSDGYFRVDNFVFLS